MPSKKILACLLVALPLISPLAATGCGMSKAAYRDRMAAVLDDTRAKLTSTVAELQQVPQSKDTQKEREALRRKLVDVLEEAKGELKAINPPDDFFSGHANLVAFLDRYIAFLQAKRVDRARSQNVGESQQAVELYQSATAAFSRAAAELSFLEYELKQTFYALINYERP